jgi:hypothetical protein
MNALLTILVTGILFISGNVFQLYPEGTRHLIAGSTDSEGHINIVFLSEGFTKSEQTSFLTYCKTFADTIFTTSPYHEYRSMFNIWGLFIESAESGTDHLENGTYKDTYFGSYFSAAFERFVDLSNDGKTRVYELLAQHMPDYDIVCVIVNDKTYGGTGGPIAVVTTNASAAISTVHEFGHSFFNLADEYEEAFTISPCEMPNVTADTIRETVKWNAWIEPTTPLPTPIEEKYSKSVGLFEGAMYKSFGWYRPMYTCMMRYLDYKFCKVCLQTQIAKIYEVLSPLTSSFPKTDTCIFNNGNELLAIHTMLIVPNTINVQWKVNEKLIENQSDTLYLKNVQLQKGPNKIVAIVQDTTSAVRTPENLSLLRDTANWVVNYSPAKNNPVVINRDNCLPKTVYEHGRLQIVWASHFLVEIVNLAGVSFISQKCNESCILDTRTISPGIYVISVENRFVKKIMRILLE